MYDKFKIDAKNIIISSGNHDVNRKECSEALSYFFKFRENMGTNEKVDELYLGKGKDYLNSIASIDNFANYSKKFFCKDDDIFEPLYSIQKRSFKNKKIGIITIHTSWLCNGFIDDKNNLLFPPVIIKEALQKISDSYLKILVKHHPLHYFKEFNFIEFQNIVQ